MSGRLVRFNKILPGNIVKHDGSNREAVFLKTREAIYHFEQQIPE